MTRQMAYTALLAAVLLVTRTVVAADAPPITDSTKLFDALDKDSDGQLAEDEVDGRHARLYHRLLRTADANDDGSLDRQEFSRGLQAQRPFRPLEKLPEPPAPEDQPNSVFSRLDMDQNGQLTVDEVPAQGRAMWTQFIKNSDQNGDGQLNRFEFMRNYYRIAGRLGDRPARIPQFVLGVFRRLDTDGDNVLTIEEVPEDRRTRFNLMLAQADENGDGKLSREEFTTTVSQMRKLGGRKAPSLAKSSDAGAPNAARKADELNTMIKRALQLDSNRDGAVDRDEAQGRLKTHFDRIDIDGSGALEREELNRAVQFMLQRRQSDR